jgi:hypothetical protein
LTPLSDLAGADGAAIGREKPANGAPGQVGTESFQDFKRPFWSKKPAFAASLQIVLHKLLISLIPTNESCQISPNPAKDSFGDFL